MDSIYSFPQYYEIAFSYRDIPGEVNVMEEAMARYSKIPVKTVLELACGTGPHMLEFLNRGYEYWGLDLNPTMLEYAQERAAKRGYSPKFYLANLKDFQLDEPADFLYIMMGSLYVRNTEELLSHFTSAQAGLKPGGLYFLDWCIDFEPLNRSFDSWVMRREGITVATRYTAKVHDAAEQLFEENILFSINDKGRERTLLHRGLRRAIYPQEFILAATKLHQFEFVGWWNDWNLQVPLGEGRGEIVRPITILRRV